MQPLERGEVPADAACCADVFTGAESKSVAANTAKPAFSAPGNDTGSVICCPPSSADLPPVVFYYQLSFTAAAFDFATSGATAGSLGPENTFISPVRFPVRALTHAVRPDHFVSIRYVFL